LDTGIYHTVHTNWQTQGRDITTDFLEAKSPAAKQDVATRYASLLAQRDAGEAALLGLRRSLLELAAEHSRAAAGGAMDTSILIASVREQIAFLKDLLADLKPAKS
jgi:hypothetical protein